MVQFCSQMVGFQIISTGFDTQILTHWKLIPKCGSKIEIFQTISDVIQDFGRKFVT